jgi:predicted nucleic acid-binding protein
MLVVDASVAVAACHTPMGFATLRGHELVAPQLMLIEASSVLHEMAWREEITKPRAETMLGRLLKAPVKIRMPADLIRSAWRVADELGWAKTYDAQYVALAQILNCRLVSVDERLLRGVARLDIAVRPREL